eukprot:1158131-Pelagomonas_calceolata.AAC.3
MCPAHQGHHLRHQQCALGKAGERGMSMQNAEDRTQPSAPRSFARTYTSPGALTRGCSSNQISKVEVPWHGTCKDVVSGNWTVVANAHLLSDMEVHANLQTFQ